MRGLRRITVVVSVLAVAFGCASGCRRLRDRIAEARHRREEPEPRERLHPSGSAIPKEITPTPPTPPSSEGGSTAGGGANDVPGPGAWAAWSNAARHNGRLLKVAAIDIRGRVVQFKGVTAPGVKRVEFDWGDGRRSSIRLLPVSHAYARNGTYKVRILIHRLVGRSMRDGTTIRVGSGSGGDSGPGGGGGHGDAPNP